MKNPPPAPGKAQMIYEFITPSDPITFKANSDKIAFYVTLLIGSGKAGMKRADGQEVELSPLFLFHPDPLPVIEQYLGCSIDQFVNTNKQEIGECFQSFAYGNIEDRQTFDDACEAITDPEKLAAFRAKHEERNRTSVSGWVAYAWKLSSKFIQPSH